MAHFIVTHNQAIRETTTFEVEVPDPLPEGYESPLGLWRTLVTPFVSLRNNPMPRKTNSQFIAYVIGPPEFERYVVKDNRVDFPRFFAGTDEGEWTDDLRKALMYANLDDLSHDIQEITKRELAHLPQRTYRMDVEVTVIGEATLEEVQAYIYEALTIELDYEGHGPGPTAGSFVMVRTYTTNLRPGDESGSG